MKSIRTRLVAWYGLVMAVTLGVFSLMTYFLSQKNLRHEVDRAIQDKAMIVAIRVNPDDGDMSGWLEKNLDAEQDGIFLAVFNARGGLMGHSGNHAPPVSLSARARKLSAERGGTVLQTIRRKNGALVRLATYPIRLRPSQHENADDKKIIGYAQAGMPLDDAEAALKRLGYWLILGAPAALALALGGGWILLKHWLNAMAKMEAVARDIGVKGLTANRISVPEEDGELKVLAQTFNAMLDRIESAFATQQRFVADASHELRTPLTVLRGEIEVCLRHKRQGSDYRAILVSALEEIERLSKLTETLLALAKADAGNALAVKESINVAVLCSGTCARFDPVAKQKNIRIQFVGENGADIDGDAVALERVFANLLDNAIRYSPAGESIQVEVRRMNAEVRVNVADNGIGIATENMKHIFGRFYRADKSRSRDAGGAGLGLSFVKAIIEAHGGTVTVHSEIGKGSVFSVILPTA